MPAGKYCYKRQVPESCRRVLCRNEIRHHTKMILLIFFAIQFVARQPCKKISFCSEPGRLRCRGNWFLHQRGNNIYQVLRQPYLLVLYGNLLARGTTGQCSTFGDKDEPGNRSPVSFLSPGSSYLKI